MDWWQVLVAVGGGLLLLWLALLTTLWITNRNSLDQATLRETLRLLPDVIRLLRWLATDPDLPRGVRVRLWLLLAYLLLPIDLIPDFVPVLGYADDALVVALALRSVTRRAGADALARHWPGTSTGLRTVQRLAGLATDY
ncbi:MAG: YkvA family protein [Pseudonocardiaceae bacterium]